MAEYTTSARPYARAVYSLATQTSTVESWGEALALMAAVAADAGMQEMLDEPQLSKAQKGELLLKVISDKLNQEQQNMIRLMAENGRLRALPEVRDQFETFRAEAEGKVEAEVISAFTLTAEQEQAIIETLKSKLGRDVSITTSTDKSLIGGVVIKAGDTIIDGSMKSRLESLALTLGR
ncbi:MAG: F0F1 ATP synthase subunit delta [Gammaproteobacteria bacterium]|jgi:F-type H+-transporting ATPase subunit delta